MPEIQMVSLSEIAHPVSRPVPVLPGESYRTFGVKWWGQGAYERATIDGSDTSATTLSIIRNEDLVINKIWVRHGSVAIAGEEVDGCAASNEFPTFVLDKTQVTPRWLHWYTKLQAFWHDCARLSQGTSGKNRIRPERFLTIKVPLPPLVEQQRIVARIDALAARIEEAKGLRAQAMTEVEAVMGAAIGRIQADEPHGNLIDVLMEKPRNGWSVLCDNEPYGSPVLTLSAVTGFFYKKNAFKTTSGPTDQSANYWLEPGDILITRSNTPELVGHAAIYSGEPYPCIYPDLIMRMKVNKEKADGRFVWFWLRSPTVREYIRRAAKGTSPTMKKISQPVVMGIPFPTQLALHQQHRIVAYLDDLQAKVDAVKHLQAETEAELDALLPSVLDRAFRGEL